MDAAVAREEFIIGRPIRPGTFRQLRLYQLHGGQLQLRPCNRITGMSDQLGMLLGLQLLK